jgi:hypothetical protein
MNPHALFDALGAIPRLPGARCAGRHELFDPRDPSDPDCEGVEAAAIAECELCNALHSCRAWVESLPVSLRPTGVVAGRRQGRRRQNR